MSESPHPNPSSMTTHAQVDSLAILYVPYKLLEAQILNSSDRYTIVEDIPSKIMRLKIHRSRD